jgi:hypothetical protein
MNALMDGAYGFRSGLPAEATEFDRFGEMIFSGAWRILTSDGRVSLIADAPGFVQDEDSWWTIPPGREPFA